MTNLSWDIHLFDPQNNLLHTELKNITVHTGWKKKSIPEGTEVRYRWPFTRGRHFVERHFPWLWHRILPEADKRLASLIDQLEPDCIHSLGMQPYTYVLFKARERLGGVVPAPWIYSSRGNDLYYWGQFPEHQHSIRQVLEACDFYICNCHRDIELAREFGFTGEVLGLFQGGGGYPVREMQSLRQLSVVSERRIIAVKGLQGAWGRALTALEALPKCEDELAGYKIVVYQAHPETREAAARLSNHLHVSIQVLPRMHYREIWRLFGKSRLSIGVNYVDGVANTMIESMIMGAFPIQTNPGGATEEWVQDGVNGLLVPHDNPDLVAVAIRRAVTDDELVNSAADLNYPKTFERIDASTVQPQVQEAYERVVSVGKKREARPPHM